MREVVKLGIILLIITAVAAAVLGYTNSITEGPIANQILQANITARQNVLPEATSFEEVSEDIYRDFETVMEVYQGMNNGEIVGYTIKTSARGYGGPVEIMIGISSDAVVTGVSVGNHTETPGLGAIITDEEFEGQYTGKDAVKDLTVIKAGIPKEDEIVSIAGATISSRAVTSGVNTAVKLFNEKLK